MHAPILETRLTTWPDEAACAAAARAFAAQPAVRDAFIELAGPLGAGKTTFVRHLLRALGVQGRIKSPSYAVVEPYDLPATHTLAWHFDFYRFDRGHEWEDAGLRELFAGPGLKLVEWAEHAQDLPVCDLHVELVPQEGDLRSVRFTAYSECGVALMNAPSPQPSPADAGEGAQA